MSVVSLHVTVCNHTIVQRAAKFDR